MTTMQAVTVFAGDMQRSFFLFFQDTSEAAAGPRGRTALLLPISHAK
jgi:hypothetical protein